MWKGEVRASTNGYQHVPTGRDIEETPVATAGRPQNTHIDERLGERQHQLRQGGRAPQGPFVHKEKQALRHRKTCSSTTSVR